MIFVKAKEPMVTTPSVENAKVQKKPNGTTQKIFTKPQNPYVAKPKVKGKFFSIVSKRSSSSTLLSPLWS